MQTIQPIANSPSNGKYGIHYLWDTGSDHQREGTDWFNTEEEAQIEWNKMKAQHHLYNLAPIGWSPSKP